MKHVLCILAALLGGVLFANANQARAAEGQSVTMVNEGEIAPDGLYLTRAKFGRSINARSGMIQVYKGYIFVSWYKGGFEDGTVWLSRKRIGRGEWQHIQFPHRHVMFRGDKNLPEDEKRGDAHNLIHIGICPKDDTIHLLYDMHAYSPSDFENDYFNYSYSKKGAATVPDSQWKIDLFHPKQNYLNKDVKREAYYRVTYPGFWTTDEGNLIVKWRVGGTHNAFMHFSEYDGRQWSPPRQWNDTRGDKQVGFYGGFTPMDGRLYARWTHRSNALRAAGYPHGGQAVYAAYSKQINGEGPWYNLAGEKFNLPIRDFEPFKVVEAESPKQKASTGPGMVMPNGDVQLIFRSGSDVTLATLPKGEDRFVLTQPKQGFPGGTLNGDELYTIDLEDGKPVVKSTKVGQENWQVRYRFTGERKFSHGSAIYHEGSFFYYLQQVKPRDDASRPLFVFRFDLPKP